MSTEALPQKKQIDDLLRWLHMPGIRSCWEQTSIIAHDNTWTYPKFLAEVLEFEKQNRKTQRIKRDLKRSMLPDGKDLQNLDQSRLPLKVKQQIQILLDGHFVKNRENILAFGNPGSGKTHVLAAIAKEQIYLGKKVFFCTCAGVVQMLLREKQNLELDKAILKLSKFDILVLDDIGYVQQSREEMEVLFTLLASRYETGSVMLSSNLPFSKWDQIFKDPMTTAAAIDRLIHHSVIIELNVPSYRTEQAKKRKNGGDK